MPRRVYSEEFKERVRGEYEELVGKGMSKCRAIRALSKKYGVSREGIASWVDERVCVKTLLRHFLAGRSHWRRMYGISADVLRRLFEPEEAVEYLLRVRRRLRGMGIRRVGMDVGRLLEILDGRTVIIVDVDELRSILGKSNKDRKVRRLLATLEAYDIRGIYFSPYVVGSRKQCKYKMRDLFGQLVGAIVLFHKANTVPALTRIAEIVFADGGRKGAGWKVSLMRTMKELLTDREYRLFRIIARELPR